MSDLIDAAIAEDEAETSPGSFKAKGPLYSMWEDPDTHTPAMLALWKALEETGPLYHRGTVFEAGEGEDYRNGICVTTGVRLASEVEVPEPSKDAE